MPSTPMEIRKFGVEAKGQTVSRWVDLNLTERGGELAHKFGVVLEHGLHV